MATFWICYLVFITCDVLAFIAANHPEQPHWKYRVLPFGGFWLFAKSGCNRSSSWWRAYIRLRYGKLNDTVMSYIDGRACEVKYTDKKGVIVGYWAYGSFDPQFPYQG